MKNSLYAKALDEAQASHTLVLTGNNRLRRSVLDEWERLKQDTESVWATPNVQPFRGWMQNLWQLSMAGVLVNWQHAKAGQVLLSTRQVERLWLDAVEADRNTALINRPAAASAAHKAWQLLEQWQLRNRPWPHYCSADMATFQNWRQLVEAKLAAEGWIDPAELPGLLADLIANSDIALPRKVYSIGLQSLSPAEQGVLNALSDKGCEVIELPLPSNSAETSVYVAASPVEEFTQAAAWARQAIQRNPQSNLAIVLLNGAQQQAPMRDALLRALHPDKIWGAQSDAEEASKTLAFNFSLGQPLAFQPIVNAALGLLAWLQQAQGVEAVAQLIQSPWVQGAAKEKEARAQLARLVLENDQPQCSVERALYLVSQKQLLCPALVKQLESARERWQQIKEKPPEKASEWLPYVTECLALAGWAQRHDQDISIDSENWQAAKHFQEVLTMVAELDLVAYRFSARGILTAIEQTAQNEIFQSQGSSAPVQVLGPLEAIGQQFDALWVLGANDETLPTPVRPDPYIPKDWQRELGMPRASASKEQAWAQQTIAQLRGAANKVVFSYYSADGDNPYRPAQALLGLPIADKVVDECGDWLARLPETLVLERVEDSVAPAIAGTHPVKAPGGSKLFEDQAACAFRAFAHWRLRAKAIQLPEWGMNAQELGICLHNALQIFWDEHKSQVALLGLADAELKLKVRAAIAAASEQRPASMDKNLNQSMQALQQAVLQPLILEWLQLEKQRAPFSQVKTEQSLQVAIGRLRLDMQADRIDQLEDGSQVLVDYKTSRRLAVSAWNPPRPEQPQLPLYAVQLQNNGARVAAVMFAQLSPGLVQPVGLTTDPDVMEGLDRGHADETEVTRGKFQPRLEELLPDWEQELQRLADDFAAGEAAVLPKNDSSCDYCDLQPLCRVNFAEADV